MEFLYDEKTPLVLNPLQCAELTRQIRGGTRELPPIGDLYFKDEYIDAASASKRVSYFPLSLPLFLRSQIILLRGLRGTILVFGIVHSDGSMNYLVEKYDSALKQMMI